MGINEESLNLNVKWKTLPKKTIALVIILLIFAFSLIRFSFHTEYIGFFAAECSGLCNANYTITSNEIVVNKFDNSTGKNIHKVLTGDFERIKFNAPLLLLSNITGTFGCPDCNDGGGYIMGFKFFWIPLNSLLTAILLLGILAARPIL